MPAGQQRPTYIRGPNWLVEYQRGWLRLDVIAGLTTAAVVIPKAMAYATIAGLPIQAGLYTAFLPMIIYAVLGTSRPLSVSTTTTLAILVGAELGELVPGGDRASLLGVTSALTLLVGTMLAGASFLRLGFVANFISEPVLIGFKAAIGVVIVLDQVPKILGIHIARGSFFHNLFATVRGIPDVNVPTLLLGLVMIGLLVGLERFWPKAPAPLIAVAAGISGASLLGLQSHGVELVGRIPQGLPPFSLPDLSRTAELWSGALGIALMSFTETIAAGRAFAAVDEPPPQANRELLATGLANLGGAFFGAMPAGGGTTQTAVNRLAGARTQLAEVVTALVSLATMVLLAPVIAQMPQATLAAIVIVYSVGLIRPEEFSAILQVRRTEFFWALSAFAGVVVIGTLKGIIVAIVVSLVALAYRAANPAVYALRRKPGTNVFRPRSDEHSGDEDFQGLLLLRIEGLIFFANVGQVSHKIRPLVQEAQPRVVALDLSGVPDIEYTVIKALTETVKRERQRGVSIWLVGLNPDVFTVVQRSALGKALGPEALYFNVETAVAKYLESSAAQNS